MRNKNAARNLFIAWLILAATAISIRATAQSDTCHFPDCINGFSVPELRQIHNDLQMIKYKGIPVIGSTSSGLYRQDSATAEWNSYMAQFSIANGRLQGINTNTARISTTNSLLQDRAATNNKSVAYYDSLTSVQTTSTANNSSAIAGTSSNISAKMNTVAPDVDSSTAQYLRGAYGTAKYISGSLTVSGTGTVTATTVTSGKYYYVTTMAFTTDNIDAASQLVFTVSDNATIVYSDITPTGSATSGVVQPGHPITLTFNPPLRFATNVKVTGLAGTGFIKYNFYGYEK